ncbi:MAG: Jag N-terminal domain-containing protein [Candidatus Omnitrophota bacterium]
MYSDNKAPDHEEIIIEVEDITVEKAIKKALKMLNAKKKEVVIDVLKEEHKGLFGMKGADLAKIKVTRKPIQ